MEEKRLGYIDACKGVGIIFVVLGHILWENPVRSWIYSFHMPLFFFLSGYTFHYERKAGLWALTKKRVMTLLVPYFSFAFFFYGYWVLIERHFNPSSAEVSPEATFYGIFRGVSVEKGLIFDKPLWFLPCLFVAILIFACILQALRRTILVILALFLCVFLGIIARFWASEVRLPWSIDAALVSLMFVGAGYYMRRTKVINNIVNNKIRFVLIVIALPALLGNYLIQFKNTFVDMSQCFYGNCFAFFVAAF